MQHERVTLHVLEPGLCTLLVDYGRPRSRSLGVPVGGAADRFSLALGNALVGNPPDCTALEISLAGPTLQSSGDLACVLYGAPFTLTSAQQQLAPGKTFTLHAGEELHIEGTTEGVRAYLCVHGGLLAARVLDSVSSLEPLQAGQELACQTNTIGHRFIHPDLNWNREPRTLRVLPGTQAEWFRESDFYGQEWSVAPASNRMGLRLNGQALEFPQRELVSEPVCPGTVQVTRDGQCIVLGIDGQTIGGYPKIAHVIMADVDKLGQQRPGDKVRMVQVSLEEATAVWQQKQRELQEWLTRLEASPWPQR